MKCKNNLFAAFLMFALLGTTAVVMAQSEVEKNPYKFKNKKIELFNGKNLNNWDFYLRKSTVDPLTIFKVQDGLIHMNPFPWGYMKTKDSYSNYKLHVEWRWPEEATNSGVFVHYQPREENSFKWLECNLIAGGAGDFICEKGVDMNERTNKKSPFMTKLAESSEKKVGEWNTMEIICVGSSIEVYVNGVLQNKGTNLNITEGSICLQCEGQDIEFRNVYLNELKQ